MTTYIGMVCSAAAPLAATTPTCPHDDVVAVEHRGARRHRRGHWAFEPVGEPKCTCGSSLRYLDEAPAPAVA